MPPSQPRSQQIQHLIQCPSSRRSGLDVAPVPNACWRCLIKGSPTLSLLLLVLKLPNKMLPTVLTVRDLRLLQIHTSFRVGKKCLCVAQLLMCIFILGEKTWWYLSLSFTKADGGYSIKSNWEYANQLRSAPHTCQVSLRRNESDFIWFWKLEERDVPIYRAREQMPHHDRLVPSAVPAPVLKSSLSSLQWVNRLFNQSWQRLTWPRLRV